jgi:hypothetical protein
MFEKFMYEPGGEYLASVMYNSTVAIYWFKNLYGE